MHYLDIVYCRETIFPFIQRNLTQQEPAPLYPHEERGMNELIKVLTFARDDIFYPTFPEKAAYIFCSIAGSQYFSNGNKRLGVATLLFFLALNNTEMELLHTQEYQKLLTDFFPSAEWEHNANITNTHALFLYNLAIVIGDRHRWGSGGFDGLKANVTKLCAHLYHAQ